jgi:hypothetical protein
VVRRFSVFYQPSADGRISAQRRRLVRAAADHRPTVPQDALVGG